MNASHRLDSDLRSFGQHWWLILIALLGCAFFGRSGAAQSQAITTPKEALGFNIGENYHIATYTQLADYWKTIAKECDRCKLVEIGRTAENRPQYMMIITSPENLKKLDYYKAIVQKLAHAENLTDEQARKLAALGKPVVWIDGGLHADETVGSQQLMEQVYQMASRSDPETLQLLNDVIGLYVQVNPDGQEMVAKWYMREADPRKRSLFGVPLLWQKYAGEDDNRDYYMANMPESTNADRQLYIEWFPQIVSNHHQDSPPGTILLMPDSCDPLNYNVDPLIPLEMKSVVAAMHTRLVAQGKGGSILSGGSLSDCWWNGAMFNSPFYHNMIGLLTEVGGTPAPMEIPLEINRELPSSGEPLPIAPKVWHYRQSIDYEIENDRALLEYAAHNHEELLYNLYRMGANSIERGSRDNWTITPDRIEALREAAEAEFCTHTGSGTGGSLSAVKANGGTISIAEPACRIPDTLPADWYKKILHDPSHRDPRAFIIPIHQPDDANTVQFIDVLLKNGITVLRATSTFQAASKSFPSGSFVVKTAQAFRPFIMDMFEPQIHPNNYLQPGQKALPVYDVTGWTLTMQMGVHVDRVYGDLNGPFERVTGLLSPPPGSISGSPSPAGYLVSHEMNNAFKLVNLLLRANAAVYWLKNPVQDDDERGAGAIWVPTSGSALPILQVATRELGISIHAISKAPAGGAYKLKPLRIGLYDKYGGLVPSGWIRWLLDQYEFPYEVVYPKTLDAGNLNRKFDVIVFSNDAFCAGGCDEPRIDNGNWGQPIPDDIPLKYKAWLGDITEDKTIPQIKRFVEAGGSVVAIGTSATMSSLLGVPTANYLTEIGLGGKQHPIPENNFYIPGSLLRLTIDNTQPLAYGMPKQVDVMYDNDPLFKLLADTEESRAWRVGWFSGTHLLDSGWARGQQYLDGGTAVVEANVGKGTVTILGPEVTFRAQPTGTFKLLFNALYIGTMKPTALQ